MMKILDRSYFSPALDLACDEALLDAAEASEGGEVLRFWRPKNYFAVLGYSNAWKEEIKSRLPVYRRCSGGGAVLQGPGLLNYSLVLEIKPGISDGIRSSNDFVMRKNRRALEQVLKKKSAGAGAHRPDSRRFKIFRQLPAAQKKTLFVSRNILVEF